MSICARERIHPWWLYDASRLPPPTIASEEAGILTVLDDDLFHGIQQNIKK
jgi:hypothetical protein